MPLHRGIRLAPLLLSALAACEPAAAPPCESVAAARARLTHGSATEAQPAIVGLAAAGRIVCSGVLLSPRVVLGVAPCRRGALPENVVVGGSGAPYCTSFIAPKLALIERTLGTTGTPCGGVGNCLLSLCVMPEDAPHFSYCGSTGVATSRKSSAFGCLLLEPRDADRARCSLSRQAAAPQSEGAAVLCGAALVLACLLATRRRTPAIETLVDVDFLDF